MSKHLKILSIKLQDLALSLEKVDSIEILPSTELLTDLYIFIMKLVYLPGSSTVVPVENIFHKFSSIANNSVKNDCCYISYLFIIFPCQSKEYLVNYHETVCSEVIDKIISVIGNDRKQGKLMILMMEVTKTFETQKIDPKKKIDQASIVSKFPVIPGAITEFLKTNGYKVQDCCRDGNFRG